MLSLLLGLALATPLPDNAELLRQIARDDSVEPTVRIEAALKALDIVESQGIDLHTQNVIDHMFMAPCDDERPQLAPATLESVYASALPDGGVAIEAHTSRPVRAMHYLHERGEERHWVLWLENVESEAATVPQGSDVAERVRIAPRDGVTAVVAELNGGERVRVELIELADGWRLEVHGTDQPAS